MSTPSCDIESPKPGAVASTPDETSEVRVEKVLEIRRQLGEGTYSIVARLDIVIERLLHDVC